MAFSSIVVVSTALSGADPGEVRDLDIVEVVEVLQPLPRTAHRLGVERVALGQAELAADHLVLGARVADDIDPLDIDARALADIEREIDNVLLAVAVDPRLHLDERIAAVVNVQFHRIDAAADGVAVIPVALSRSADRGADRRR